MIRRKTENVKIAQLLEEIKPAPASLEIITRNKRKEKEESRIHANSSPYEL